MDTKELLGMYQEMKEKAFRAEEMISAGGRPADPQKTMLLHFSARLTDILSFLISNLETAAALPGQRPLKKAGLKQINFERQCNER